MPQLHDSGNRGHAGASASAHAGDFARIFGIETEYGLSVTGASRPCDAGQVAMMMFQPIMQRVRSTNTYLANGSRLYLDVGAHPEYATAEARTPGDATLADAAGERIMRDLALDAQRRLRATHGPDATVHLFKNNADSAGHSFGCHENYLVRRGVPLGRIETQLLPFLITRQILTGAGRFDGARWHVTQRAAFVDETVSSATTRSRPMINTRDEPHADPESFRRLHVIIGDSNRSQWATTMKLAMTHLVLCLMEWGARHDQRTGLESIALADPVEANLAVDAEGPRAALRLADGTTASPLALQRRVLGAVLDFVRARRDEVAASFDGDPLTTLDDVLGDWELGLESLAYDDEGTGIADRADWACKRRFAARLAGRGAVDPMRLAQLDLDYHDIANGALFASLERHGMMRVLCDEAQVDRAVTTPPAGTRAVLRGAFVTRAESAPVTWSCDWTQLRLTEPVKDEVMLLDPFDAVGDARYARLLALVDGARGVGADMTV
ncbi:proteasome-associated protein [Bifidobacterium italicum]|uniref:Proteasome-associated protein n=1 Tax=Bifidobacterium italicum TaxID=1960968 RepID=A0A2A2EF71_9BIFI|nr:proteasome accessory factor PafA2 family protein [Bifidobacterium italicum]PAU67548.1 proteasome-associated protein [Bifidobacterium italicum]